MELVDATQVIHSRDIALRPMVESSDYNYLGDTRPLKRLRKFNMSSVIDIEFGFMSFFSFELEILLNC